jgi:hypothetical protein
MTRRVTKKLASDAAIEEHESRGKRFHFIRQRLKNVNIEEVWEKLENDLSLGDGRKSPEKILMALDETESNLRRAGMILQVAIEEYDEFEIHFRSAYAGWSHTARKALEIDKKEKRLSSQITLVMIEDWVIANVPDYRKWNKIKNELKRHKNLCKQMHAAWESRGASLRKLSDLVERRRGVSPDMLPRKNKEN